MTPLRRNLLIGAGAAVALFVVGAAAGLFEEDPSCSVDDIDGFMKRHLARQPLNYEGLPLENFDITAKLNAIRTTKRDPETLAVLCSADLSVTERITSEALAKFPVLRSLPREDSERLAVVYRVENTDDDRLYVTLLSMHRE
jgi:hypothetical protein